ncbi:hypothetical protein GGX14DRAFT_392839 [Mycena pura]|uniref:Uncharacterized protein n=1 Tax=Mycena pura TaxID=153505 RepID=A0AAD6YDX4_9AGAR|nr:hypothetical protein GGX14DRAFT_392839 [Mycena pura]
MVDSNRERKIYCDDKCLGLFFAVKSNFDSVISDLPHHNLLSNAEKDSVALALLPSFYLDCWKDHRSWIAFDLDDTLHEFRRASGAATTGTLEAISEKYGTPLSAEGAVLVHSQGEDCERVLGRKDQPQLPPRALRRRAGALLAPYLPQPSRILTIYKRTLTTSLELKCGAAGLLSTLKRLGKKMEGPQDAQERTIQAPGRLQRQTTLA